MSNMLLNIRHDEINNTLTEIIQSIHNNCLKTNASSETRIIFEVRYSNQKTPAQMYNEYKYSPEYQKQALIYIIVVLAFYSITIIGLMIKYMKKERCESQDKLMHSDVLTREKEHSLQQAKSDYARRVSLQLVGMTGQAQQYDCVRMTERKVTIPMKVLIEEESSTLMTTVPCYANPLKTTETASISKPNL